MKTTLCLCAFLVGLLASVVPAAAVDESATCVSTSRSLRVACVRDSSEEAPWYVMQQAFATSMSACLSEKDVSTMPVRVLSASPSRAANDLANGECDAVLVMGEYLPSALRDDNFTSTRAVTQVGVPVRVFHFVLRNNDAASLEILTAAFEKATASASFQDTIGRASAIHSVVSNLGR
jgi:ABC-type amino acid transport substrate-binding protein